MRPTRTWQVRLGLDVAASCVGLLVVVAAVVLLVEGVEEARSLSAAGEDATAWLAHVLARWPGEVIAVLPVSVALGAARTAAAWERSGQLVVLESCGVHPARTAAVIGLAAGLVAFATLGARELVAWPAARALSGQGGWAVVASPVPEGAARAFVRATSFGDAVARDVVVAWVDDGGALVGRGHADRATWDGGWTLEGAEASAWPRGAERAVPLVLPDPEAWRSAAMEAGVDAPLGRLLVEPSPARRDAWLADRALTGVGAALLAALALPLVGRDRRWGLAMVLAVAAAWRLVEGSAVVAAANGTWSIGAAMVAQAGAMVAGAGVAWAAGRRRA